MQNNKKNILIAKSANEWLEIGSKIKDPEELFGNFWHEGEVGILFSNTGIGVQLAEGISSGNPTVGLNCKKRKVIYFDFELSTKSFQLRYSTNNMNLHNFSNEFIRVEIDKGKNTENAKTTKDNFLAQFLLKNMFQKIVRVKLKLSKINFHFILFHSNTFLK